MEERLKKSVLSGRSTTPRGSPRGSPSFRKLNSGRTTRRDGRSQWIRNNSVLLWLLLITLWAYLGFYVQSKWAHSHNDNDNKNQQLMNPNYTVSDEDMNYEVKTQFNISVNGDGSNNVSSFGVSLAKKGSARRSMSVKKTRKGRQRGKKGKAVAVVAVTQHEVLEEEVDDIPKKNTSYGLLVGPFTSTEERILEWSPEKRMGTCDRKGDFARLVWSRRYVLIFHELSMTGAPLSMMELATELMSCGATVSAVVLNKRGGLMKEITRRRIKVIEDKEKISFKAAMKADLVIAGSAVCASWIEQYHEQFPAASSQIVWWIMENRLEYFNRSKLMLSRVKMLIFLSESQSKQWLSWCQGEGIKLYTPPAIIPLSVHDDLAFVAGIPCSLNTPAFSVEKMSEKRLLLRDAVRKEMGLTENDMLVMSLSSINPGKGQLLLLESARLIFEENLSVKYSKIKKAEKDHSGIIIGQNNSSSMGKSRALIQERDGIVESANVLPRSNKTGGAANVLPRSNKTGGASKKTKRKRPVLRHPVTSNNTKISTPISRKDNRRKILSSEPTPKDTLKMLVGSVGSKSNKVSYVKGLLQFLSQHSELSKAVLWTPATTHVASLYSATDVYVINSQGLGETFGRVTIEAMAYGLPVLGTDAGGTKEIVEHNVTGLLHPLGRPGSETLAQNLLFFLDNPDERKKMGIRGREKVEKEYLKRHMYQKFAVVLSKCMKPK